MQQYLPELSSKIHKNQFLLDLSFFFAASVGGWLWEVLVFWVQHSASYSPWKLLLSYRGFLHGPWAPIYGVGTLMMVLLHRRLKKRPVCYFLICMGICAVVEYVTSWGLEQLFHGKRLDYTGYFLNVNGRICAMSLLFFALTGMAVSYILAPLFHRWVEKLPRQAVIWVSMGLAILFLMDTLMSLAGPNMGLGVQTFF